MHRIWGMNMEPPPELERELDYVRAATLAMWTTLARRIDVIQDRECFGWCRPRREVGILIACVRSPVTLLTEDEPQIGLLILWKGLIAAVSQRLILRIAKSHEHTESSSTATSG